MRYSEDRWKECERKRVQEVVHKQMRRNAPIVVRIHTG